MCGMEAVARQRDCVAHVNNECSFGSGRRAVRKNEHEYTHTHTVLWTRENTAETKII